MMPFRIILDIHYDDFYLWFQKECDQSHISFVSSGVESLDRSTGARRGARSRQTKNAENTFRAHKDEITELFHDLAVKVENILQRQVKE